MSPLRVRLSALTISLDPLLLVFRRTLTSDTSSGSARLSLTPAQHVVMLDGESSEIFAVMLGGSVRTGYHYAVTMTIHNFIVIGNEF